MALRDVIVARPGEHPLPRRYSLWERPAAYWLFTLPVLAVLFGLLVIPLGYAFTLSLRNFDLLRSLNTYAGFQNYAAIVRDPAFLMAFLRTLLYVAVVVAADFCLGFSQALLVFVLPNAVGRVLRGVFLLPILLIPSAAAMLWRSVMYGSPFQEFNRVVHLPLTLTVLGRPSTAFWGIIFTVIWAWSPWVFLLLSGGLQSLEIEPLEAAQVDGASFPRLVWHVILPMMRPVIFVTLSFKAVDSFLTFPFPWVMTQGGPAGSSHVLSTYIYQTSFQFLNYGYGSAMALVMLGIGALLSASVIVVAWTRGYA